LAGKVLINKDGASAWQVNGPTQGKCLWEMHGVWGWDEVKKVGVLLRESYFQKDPNTGKKVRLSPFVILYVGYLTVTLFSLTGIPNSISHSYRGGRRW